MSAKSVSRTVVLGTRSSKLALWQTEHVAGLLRSLSTDIEPVIVPITTQGDRILDKPLPEIGGKGLFTLELESAILDGTIDLAVHSLKDLPTEESPGLTLGAIIGRADVRDALVSRNGETLAELPPGAVVGTSSIRRQAQLLAARPDLTVRSIRGNVDTRIRKVMEGEYDAAVLAAAGIIRLGLDDKIAELLPFDTMLPAPGQGALAAQCRADDAGILALMARIDNPLVRAATVAERAFLQYLGGGCSAPIGAYAETHLINGTPHLMMQACIGAPDGSLILRVAGEGAEPHELASMLADDAIRQGARRLLFAGAGAGARVLVARASEQAGEFAENLSAQGFIPVEVPLIATVALPDPAALAAAIQRLSDYDWVVFTSVNGVRYFYDLYDRQMPAQGIPSGVRIAAVGPATADELGKFGRRPDYVPERFSGSDLAAGLANGRGDVRGKRFLLVRAEVAGRELPDALIARGALVNEAPAYRTVANVLSDDQIAMMSTVSIIALTSGSSARALAAALAAYPALAPVVGNAVTACIGPSTAAVAAEVGLRVNTVATEHTLDGLITAIIAFLEKEQQ